MACGKSSRPLNPHDESKGELWLIALFLVLLALVVLRFFRH